MLDGAHAETDAKNLANYLKNQLKYLNMLFGQ
jgi:hypothetical protein